MARLHLHKAITARTGEGVDTDASAASADVVLTVHLHHLPSYFPCRSPCLGCLHMHVGLSGHHHSSNSCARLISQTSQYGIRLDFLLSSASSAHASTLTNATCRCPPLLPQI